MPPRARGILGRPVDGCVACLLRRLDVHKKTVVACVRRVDPVGKVSKSIKTFATMTAKLLDLSDWLAAQGVKVVAMESTGSYWKPVFNLLEPRFEVVLVNAHHIKQVPGRKTGGRQAT